MRLKYKQPFDALMQYEAARGLRLSQSASHAETYTNTAQQEGPPLRQNQRPAACTQDVTESANRFLCHTRRVRAWLYRWDFHGSAPDSIQCTITPIAHMSTCIGNIMTVE